MHFQHSAIEYPETWQTCERPGCRSIASWAGLKQLDNEPGHHCGDPAVAFCPGHRQFFDCAVAVLELGDSGFDDGLELASIEVSPLALAPAIDVCPLGCVCWVSPHLALLQNNFDHHALVR